MVDVLRGFARIRIPFGARDDAWIAQTVHCNTQVTTGQVRRARAILVAHDPAIPEQDGWSPEA